MKNFLVCPRFDEDSNLRLKKEYINFFNKLKINLTMIQIMNKKDLKKIIASFDGLLLPGGGDFDPKYSKIKDESIIYSKELDEFELLLIETALEFNLPIIGICRGIQAINLYFNGTLKMDIPNHNNTNHFVKLIDSSLLLESQFLVNSYHHQALDKINKNLIPTLISKDKIIEGVIHRFLKIIGFQFHIEKLENPLRNRLIKTLKNYLEIER